MKRDYLTGKDENPTYFTGIEVEHTPVYGMPTLFVVGLQDPLDILVKILDLGLGFKHVFCGANHSFNPTEEMKITGKDLYDTVTPWDEMMLKLLDTGHMVTLDFDVRDVETVLEMRCNEHNNFIPQVSVKIPYIKQLNYNAMIKIDDKTFNASNPGVWCHRVNELMDHTKFTPWRDYMEDLPR